MNPYKLHFDNTYETLPSYFYSKGRVRKYPAPKILLFNEELAQELGLDRQALVHEGVEVLAGSSLPEGASGISQAYMGHQFGYQTMLGDGRAMLLGEHLTPNGERYDLQYKGSGPTPYSRGGDGNAALGPMIREYIISTGLHHLGVPTSRSLSVVTTGSNILRTSRERGAVLLRVAKSHLRIGTFEYAAKRGTDALSALTNYAINRHYPEFENVANKSVLFYESVALRQAKLIAQWMNIGFIHGVMNTDNMSIAGESIDFGPCAFLDILRPKTVFSSIDSGGRYAFDRQGSIGAWNLQVLGINLAPLFEEEGENPAEVIDYVLKKYTRVFQETYYDLLAKRLGFEEGREEHYPIINKLLSLLETDELDYHNTFLDLTFGRLEKDETKSDSWQTWIRRWQETLEQEGLSLQEAQESMKEYNPALIPRNYWVEKAIQEAEEGKLDTLNELLKGLQTPYVHTEEKKNFQKVPRNMFYQTYCGT